MPYLHRAYRLPAALGLIVALGLFLRSEPRLAFAAGEEDFLAGKSKACPNCALAHAPLKRKDLTGADLSGANLAGADLSDARLTRAILTGANLEGAKLSGTLMPDGSTHE